MMDRFSDFAKPFAILDGEKIRIDKALNRELVILSFRVEKSKYDDRTRRGLCLTLQVEIEGERRVIFTASEVLIDQIEEYKDRLPFLAKIEKVDGRFYRFT